MPSPDKQGAEAKGSKAEAKESTDVTLAKINKWINKDKSYFTSMYEQVFNYCENLYQSKRDVKGLAPWRSNTFIPIPFYTIQDQMPRTMDGLIGQGDFFSVFPRNDQPKGKNKALIYEKLMRYHMDKTKGNFYGSCHDWVENGKKKGIGFLKMSWYEEDGNNEYFDVKDGSIQKIKEVVKEHDGPMWEHIEKLYFDSGAMCWADVRRVIEETHKTLEDVKELLGNKAYDDAEIKRFISDKENGTDTDPTDRYLFHMVYTKNKWYGVLDGKYLLRNHLCPYKRNRIQIYPYVKYPEVGKIVGRGLCQVLADITESSNDIANLVIDGLMMTTAPTFAIKSDADMGPIDIFPGAMNRFDDPREDLIKMDLGSVNPQAFAQLDNLMGLANRISGGAAGITSPDGPAPINNKTATGAVIIREEVNWTYSYEIKYNKRQGLRPMVKDLIDMIEQYQDSKQAEQILGEKFFKDYKDDGMEAKDFDAPVEIDFILQGEEGLKGRQEDLDSLMSAMQIFAQLEQLAQNPVIASKVNIDSILTRISKDLELPEDFLMTDDTKGAPPVIDVNTMTPEQKNRLMVIAQVLKTTPEAIMQRVNAGEDLRTIDAQAEQIIQSGGVK